MKDDDARELEKQLESGEFHPFRLQKSDAFEYFVEGEKADVSVINDDSIDKQGEIVDPDTLDFTKFQKNPVVAFNHNYEIPPVGKSIWQKKTTKGWIAKTVFNSKPDDFKDAWFPDTLFHMIKEGSMRGKSIGGACSWREIAPEDVEKHPSWKGAKRVTKSVQVWEYSICPIGVNSNTVVEAVSKGMILDEAIIALMGTFMPIDEIRKACSKPEIPVITQFLTQEQHLRQREAVKSARLNQLEAEIPSIAERVLKRKFGKVV
jgi:hypothetical protein